MNGSIPIELLEHLQKQGSILTENADEASREASGMISLKQNTNQKKEIPLIPLA